MIIFYLLTPHKLRKDMQKGLKFIRCLESNCLSSIQSSFFHLVLFIFDLLFVTNLIFVIFLVSTPDVMCRKELQVKSAQSATKLVVGWTLNPVEGVTSTSLKMAHK